MVALITEMWEGRKSLPLKQSLGHQTKTAIEIHLSNAVNQCTHGPHFMLPRGKLKGQLF